MFQDKPPLRTCARVVAVLLAGCAAAPEDPPPSPETVQELREEAAVEDSVVEVTPLSDPHIQELQERATAAEQAGDLDRARVLVVEALDLAPRDPQLWQRLAELDLMAGAFEQAIERARHSFEVGPKVGALCSRNWLTIARANRELGRPQLESEARETAQSCPVRARPRL